MKPKIPFDASIVRDLFDYDGGSLSWRERPRSDFTSDGAWKRSNTRRAGKLVGSKLGEDGYIRVNITIKNRLYKVFAHRLVWAWHHGRWPHDLLDHIDQDKSNNAIENLREVCQAENHKNRPLQKNNRSGVTGVYWDKGRNKWHAYIKYNKKYIGLGRFVCFGQAIKARKEAQIKAGFHENHGR